MAKDPGVVILSVCVTNGNKLFWGEKNLVGFLAKMVYTFKYL
jgi:hypothetical protein